jgi:hypothetical protein
MPIFTGIAPAIFSRQVSYARNLVCFSRTRDPSGVERRYFQVLATGRASCISTSGKSSRTWESSKMKRVEARQLTPEQARDLKLAKPET